MNAPAAFVQGCWDCSRAQGHVGFRWIIGQETGKGVAAVGRPSIDAAWVASASATQENSTCTARPAHSTQLDSHSTCCEGPCIGCARFAPAHAASSKPTSSPTRAAGPAEYWASACSIASTSGRAPTTGGGGGAARAAASTMARPLVIRELPSQRQAAHARDLLLLAKERLHGLTAASLTSCTTTAACMQPSRRAWRPARPCRALEQPSTATCGQRWRRSRRPPTAASPACSAPSATWPASWPLRRRGESGSSRRSAPWRQQRQRRRESGLRSTWVRSRLSSPLRGRPTGRTFTCIGSSPRQGPAAATSLWRFKASRR